MLSQLFRTIQGTFVHDVLQLHHVDSHGPAQDQGQRQSCRDRGNGNYNMPTSLQREGMTKDANYNMINMSQLFTTHIRAQWNQWMRSAILMTGSTLFTTVKQKLLETAWDRHCKAKERGHAEFDGLRCIGASVHRVPAESPKNHQALRSPPSKSAEAPPSPWRSLTWRRWRPALAHLASSGRSGR